MSSAPNNLLAELAYQSDRLSIGDFLALLSERFPRGITFSTSFSYEDQIVLHEIAAQSFPVAVFTLDTGRLFPETYSVWNTTREKYNIPIQAYYPDYRLLEEFVTEKGPNAFYEAVESRKQCCYIRKVEPLKRALQGFNVWITGLRAEHSPDRQSLSQIEWDESNQLIKYHPLLHWTTAQVKNYINEHNVPYNILHDRGFVSIGCAPCTRAIREGEDFRAGRWWWEDASKKECGLHVHR